MSVDLQSIFGHDERVRVTDYMHVPFSRLCRIKCSNSVGSWIGSGFFVSPRCVVTCGHVLFDHESGRGLADRMDFYPAGAGHQPVQHSGWDYWYFDQWMVDANPAYDYCLIGLRSPRVHNDGVILDVEDDAHVQGEHALKYVVGFLESDNDDLYASAGRVTAFDRTFLQYDMDTEPGSSGSAIVNRSGYIVGLNRGHVRDGNVGIRFTKELNDWIWHNANSHDGFDFPYTAPQ